ncbi:hypothetical protein [Cellulomonas denverensis]|uniref:Lipoprotein n=1 Tax=Cellulomonas denverensis TaxID=264297 RepID=A0A7X6R0B3_9CELL|nr:hypothetical protein [Cellulomonas denverensis]NKY24053.1 hypothetical protein [Cellulomonas denverensis]GIG26536.1 hypothetical protein Cde04nite_27800 [Cellulomonas denverensis]
MSRPRVLPVLALAVLALLSSCSGGGDTPLPTATVTAPAATVTAEPTAAPTSAGCVPAGDGVPGGAQSITTLDLDGDGGDDQLWIADDGADRTLGVTTASGATFTHPIDLAGPAGATAFALRPAPGDPGLVLLSDNRVADLLMVQGCALVAVTDAEGRPWQFDLGFAGNGTGVGCVDLTGDGQPDLAGLNADPDTGTVERTQITLTGTVAAAGTRDQVTPGAQDDTAHAITCGDRTMDADGVREAQG